MRTKSTLLIISLASLTAGSLQSANAQTPDWSLAGNNATTSSKLGTTNAVPLRLFTKNAERLRLDTLGRVGIGTTTPFTLFHVGGFGSFGNRVTAANATRALNLVDDNAVMRVLRIHATNAPAVELISRTSADGPNVAYWDFYAQPSDKSFRIRDRVGSGSGLDRLTIANNGNIGIGTTSPLSPLDVNSSIGGQLARFNGSNGLFIGIYENGAYRGYLGSYAGNAEDVDFGTGGGTSGKLHLTIQAVPKLTIANNGNVGIGTTDPSYPLDVRSPGLRGISAVNTYTGDADNIGVYGYTFSTNNPGYGYGMQAAGGLCGIIAQGVGENSIRDVTGVYGVATGSGGVGTRTGVKGWTIGGAYAYGVYGYASEGPIFNAAGYFEGDVYANNYFFTSDRKFKRAISPLSNPLEQLMKLKPAAYEFKTAEYAKMGLPKGKQMGLIADEVKQVFPELVKQAVRPAEYDKDKKSLISSEIKYEAVNYQGLIPVLIASMQELKTQNDALKEEVAQLRQLVMDSKSEKSISNTNLSSASLQQNLPNPVHGTTIIRYRIPSDATNAKLVIMDMKGALVKSVAISNNESGQVSLDVSTMAAGTYTYSLWLNGKQVDTKKMVVGR